MFAICRAVYLANDAVNETEADLSLHTNRFDPNFRIGSKVRLVNRFEVGSIRFNFGGSTRFGSFEKLELLFFFSMII